MSQPTQPNNGGNANNSRRRASFSPGSLSDLLSGGRAPPGPYPGPITTAAAEAAERHRRQSSAGISNGNGSPTQASPLFGFRRGSISSVSTSSSAIDESAVADEPAVPPSPIARRMSFGAKALRDVRTLPSVSGRSQSFASGNGSPGSQEGFPWGDVKSAHTGLVHHNRRESLSTVPVPTSELKAKAAELPKKADPLQERMLKGDFNNMF